jgi:hypothetical protein
MVKLYLETNEFAIEDMLLNASDYSNLNFVCNDTIDGIDEERVELGQNYGYLVHYGLDLFTCVKTRIYDLLKTNSNLTLCIDNLSNWLLGIDQDATTIEQMYTEYQVDELREFILVLVKESNKHDISLLCNDYMLQFIVDTIDINDYTLID